MIDGNRRAIALDELFLEGLHTMLGKLVYESFRPRVNKKDSLKDREQKSPTSVGRNYFVVEEEESRATSPE